MADLLADAGLLVRDGGFRNAPDTEAFLAGRGPFDLRPLARYWDLVSYPTWTHASARFGAGEFLMIGGGDLYQVDEVARWLGAAGWRFAGHHPLPPPSGLIVAEPA